MRVVVEKADFDAYVAHLRAGGIRVIMPNQPERAIVVDALMALSIVNLGWSRNETANGVSVTLPALPSPIPTLLTIAGVAIEPYSRLGAMGVKALAELCVTPVISLSPDAVSDPTEGFFVLTHEDEHAEESDAGGIVHDVEYLVAPEYRLLAAECPAYACDIARAMWCDGADPFVEAKRLAEGLRAYVPVGAQTDALIADANAMLAMHARALADGLCPPVRSLIDGVRFLQGRGVLGLPELPAVA